MKSDLYKETIEDMIYEYVRFLCVNLIIILWNLLMDLDWWIDDRCNGDIGDDDVYGVI